MGTHIQTPVQDTRWSQLRCYSACGRLASLSRPLSLTSETRDRDQDHRSVVSTRTRSCLMSSPLFNHPSRPPLQRLWPLLGQPPSTATQTMTLPSPLASPQVYPTLVEPLLRWRSPPSTAMSTRWRTRRLRTTSPSQSPETETA